MDNPYNKFLKQENVVQEEQSDNPYKIFLNAENRGESSFSLSNEDPAVDYTNKYKMPDNLNPYEKFLNKGEFGTGTQEDVTLNKKVGNAFYLGFLDTARGVNQMSGGDLFGASS